MRQKVIQSGTQSAGESVFSCVKKVLPSINQDGRIVNNQILLQTFRVLQRKFILFHSGFGNRLQIPGGDVILLKIYGFSTLTIAPAVVLIIAPVKLCRHTMQDGGCRERRGFEDGLHLLDGFLRGEFVHILRGSEMINQGFNLLVSPVFHHCSDINGIHFFQS